MDLHEILLSGGAGVLALLTLIQITPVKINPWSALCKAGLERGHTARS